MTRIEKHAPEDHEQFRCYQLAHPDQATEAMNLLAQALICLTDKEAKKAYDAKLQRKSSSKRVRTGMAGGAPAAGSLLQPRPCRTGCGQPQTSAQENNMTEPHDAIHRNQACDPGDAPAAAQAPLDRLLALKTPPTSSLAIHLQPHQAAVSRTLRNITATPVRGELSFRLGDWVRFGFQANQDCHVALIDIGTSGIVSVIVPNVWRTDARIAGGKPHFLPAVKHPEFEFTLDGPPGMERVLALATAAPLSVPLLPEGSDSFRTLPPAEIVTLLQAVERLAPETWAATICEFAIES